MGMSKHGAQKSTAIIIIKSYFHIFPLHFSKTVCPILRHARVFCTESLPNFLHHWRRRSSSPGRNVFHVCPCYKEQDMHQFHQHVQRHATPCNAMQRYVALFPLKTLPEIYWDLCSALDLPRLYWKTLSFSQQFVFDIFALENGWKRCLQTKRSFENTKCRAKQPDNLHRFCYSSTSAKRSWGPCWKFDIALWCLKLQETEFYT